MIIGNGMISNIFKDNFINNEVIIFASGVSNSKEKRDEAFSRETTLIYEVIQKYPDKIFIYFSTCSIHNSIKTKYIEHKFNIENIIINSCNKYLILRLPIVLGRYQNKNQLIGYLFEKNINGEMLDIYKNANRYLIDSNDLPSILKLLLDKGILNDIIDIAFNNSIMIDDLLKLIEKITNKPFLKNYTNIESPYFVENYKFLTIIKDSNIFNTNIESMILKYYK